MNGDTTKMPIVLEADRAEMAGQMTQAMSCVIHAGDLILAEVESPEYATLLVDSLSGVLPVRHGTIRFLGHDWQSLRADEANSLRGLIGRFFARGAWIGHLSVENNLLLQQLHHTRKAAAALRTEAVQLAQEFGLPGLPQNAPADLQPMDLHRAALIRAFLGQPRLILLEHPVLDSSGLLPAMLNVMNRARRHGAAVLWFTHALDIQRKISSFSTGQWRIAASGNMQVLS